MNLLSLALSFIIVGLFKGFYCRLITVILLLVIYYRYDYINYKKYSIFLLLFLVFSININSSDIKYGYVNKIRNNYFQLTNGLYQLVVYGDSSNVNLYDKVIINTDYKPITSNTNFEVANYYDYCRGNNIIGTLTIKDVQVIPTFLKTIKTTIDSDLYLYSSTAIKLSLILSLFKMILKKFFYRSTVNKMVLFLSILLSYNCGFDYGCIRIMIISLLNCLDLDNKNKTAIYIIILAYYRPYYICSLAFLLPVSYRLINCLTEKRSFFVNLLVCLIIQLIFLEEVSILQLVLFPVFRILGSLNYLISLFGLNNLLPEQIDNLYLITNKYLLSGHINIFLICIIVSCFYFYIVKNKNRYISFIILLLLINNFIRLFIPIYTVSYLDVSQADCAIITLPFSQKGLMIDCGGNMYKDIGNDIIIPYLKREKIRELEIIITHHDIDHDGSLSSLSKSFLVTNIYSKKMQQIMIKNLKVLNPVYDKEYYDENKDSLVSYFKINQFGFLFLADVDKEVEKDIAYQYNLLDVDVVKIAHHGSNTSTSEVMLSTFKPELAIISVGNNNAYNHPDERVINLLDGFKIKRLQTNINGAIKIYVFNHLMIYQTAKNKFGLLFK